jgi:hypothetical protein
MDSEEIDQVFGMPSERLLRSFSAQCRLPFSWDVVDTILLANLPSREDWGSHVYTFDAVREQRAAYYVVYRFSWSPYTPVGPPAKSGMAEILKVGTDSTLLRLWVHSPGPSGRNRLRYSLFPKVSFEDILRVGENDDWADQQATGAMSFCELSWRWLLSLVATLLSELQEPASTEPKITVHTSETSGTVERKIKGEMTDSAKAISVSSSQQYKDHDARTSDDSALYNHIVDVIYKYGTDRERRPATYRGKGETELRDDLLGVLNTHFDSATGETINHEGKTDILVSHERKIVFIGECKMWHGSEEYRRAIDQLLERQCTWQDDRVALILFIKNRNMRQVVQQIPAATQTHRCFIVAEEPRLPNSHVFRMKLPADPSTVALMTVLCFHFPDDGVSAEDSQPAA